MKNYYITNDELKKEIIKSLEENEITKELHILFYKLATNISMKNTFKDKTKHFPYLIDDMINEGYIKCTKKYKNFDFEYNNPFSFFTTIISNAFLDCIYKENKYTNIQDENKEKIISIIYSK